MNFCYFLFLLIDLCFKNEKKRLRIRINSKEVKDKITSQKDKEKYYKTNNNNSSHSSKKM